MRQSLLLLCFVALLGKAQVPDTVQADSSTLSLSEVLKLTLAYHPIVKQANLLETQAEANMRQARGGFDPKLSLDYQLKDFKETEYYNLLTTSLKVPTRIGIDPKVEFSKNQGDFVNPENFISDQTANEQIAVGINVPIGKGLFYDERRNVIQRAEAFSDIALAEQTKETNKILFTVAKDYWTWYQAYQKQLLLRQAIVLAQNLFDRTLIDFQFGEAAMVDTLQAKINFQKRTVDYQKALLDYELSKLQLARHLWSETLQPLELRNTVIPDSVTTFLTPANGDLKEGIDFAMANHPDINKLEGKRGQLDADLRWAKESLKPQVDLSYSLIDAPVDPDFNSKGIEFGENYKMGVDFSIPLLLRKERGKLQLTKLKIQDNEFELAQNQIEIRNGVVGAYTQSVTFQNLLNQYAGVSENYRRLLQAEIINLENGETDVFKLNIQQDKYIESQSDYIDAFTKWEKSKAAYFYSTGYPYLGLQELFGIVTE